VRWQSYTWDPYFEASPTPAPQAASTSGKPSLFPAATMGLKRVGYSTDLTCRIWGCEHHLLELATFVEPGAYQSASGTMPFQLGVMHKQWEQGMIYTHLPLSLGAIADNGGANVFLQASLLQLNGISVDDHSGSTERQGTITWPGNDTPPTDPRSTSEQVLFFSGQD